MMVVSCNKWHAYNTGENSQSGCHGISIVNKITDRVTFI
jgi:hypothetical protein